ncbi:MAG: hypothetical protein IE926_09890 [Micrococcales bacterium]|nr:hypothetical protein [Micrococcales bacterium]
MKDLDGSYFRNAVASGPFHDYKAVSVCGNAGPDSPNDGDLCPQSWGLCRIATGGGDGPAVVVYRRVVERDGTPVAGPLGQWQQVALTCYPERVPGNGNALTMAMIRDAFHDTDFTVPTVNIQPEGDVTLVNLPTYFQVQFPESGFGPDEVDTPDPARLLGHHIEVRPRLKSVTYHLGERTIGPTQDLGGPYPNGTVVQTYTRPGSHQVRVDIVYTGQFRVGGSGWIDIPGEVDLQGTPVTLSVREARSRLYTG